MAKKKTLSKKPVLKKEPAPKKPSIPKVSFIDEVICDGKIFQVVFKDSKEVFRTDVPENMDEFLAKSTDKFEDRRSKRR